MNEENVKEEKATAREKAFQTASRGKRAGNGKNLLKKIFMNRQIYLMLLPVVVFYLVYNYVPMYGIVLAWKEWRPKYGIMGSPWIGWENFQTIFSQKALPNAIRNTVIISSLKLLFCFPLPILFALFLNEIKAPGFKKVIQTMMYLPNFISWVILGGIVRCSWRWTTD